MKYQVRTIDPEIAPEMGWEEFLLACFRKQDARVYVLCYICGATETLRGSEEKRIEQFLDSGWRYERTFDGIIPKCKSCARKHTDKYRRYV